MHSKIKNLMKFLLNPDNAQNQSFIFSNIEHIFERTEKLLLNSGNDFGIAFHNNDIFAINKNSKTSTFSIFNKININSNQTKIIKTNDSIEINSIYISEFQNLLVLGKKNGNLSFYHLSDQKFIQDTMITNKLPISYLEKKNNLLIGGNQFIDIVNMKIFSFLRSIKIFDKSIAPINSIIEIKDCEFIISETTSSQIQKLKISKETVYNEVDCKYKTKYKNAKKRIKELENENRLLKKDNKNIHEKSLLEESTIFTSSNSINPRKIEKKIVLLKNKNENLKKELAEINEKYEKIKK